MVLAGDFFAQQIVNNDVCVAEDFGCFLADAFVTGVADNFPVRFDRDGVSQSGGGFVPEFTSLVKGRGAKRGASCIDITCIRDRTGKVWLRHC